MGSQKSVVKYPFHKMLLMCLLHLLFLLSSCLSIPMTRSCPDEPGWLSTDSSCYLVSHVKMTWSEAHVFCYERDAYLVEIQSHEEDALLDLMLPEDMQYWIGLSDWAVEGTYRWADSHRVADYTNWAPRQPDGHEGLEADCVFKSYLINHVGWHDYPCNYLEWYGPIHA